VYHIALDYSAGKQRTACSSVKPFDWVENYPMRYVIVDLVATCWGKGTSPDRQEIIEIGAVSLDSNVGPASEEFACFVRPLIRPFLSAFCVKLTGVRQEDVDRA
jgi:3'-5' exoribonuclease 1